MNIFKNKSNVFLKKIISVLSILSIFLYLFLGVAIVVNAADITTGAPKAIVVPVSQGGGVVPPSTSAALQNWSIYDANGNYNPTAGNNGAITSSNGNITGVSPVITPSSQTPSTASPLTADCGLNVSNTSWSYCMLAPVYPLLGGTKTGDTQKISLDGGLQPFFANLYQIGIAITIGLSVVVISLGGIRLATTDSISGTEKGRDMVKAALAGLFLALFSYVLLNTINPALVNNGVGDVFTQVTKTPTVTPGK